MQKHTDFDKACRYLIKYDPRGFFSWLRRLNDPPLTFLRWADARRLAVPGEGELTDDLVAEFADPQSPGRKRFLIVEPVTRSQRGGVDRMLKYVVRFRSEPKPGRHRAPSVGAVVVNLTGPSQPDRIALEVWPDTTLNFCIRQRTLREESATDLLSGIEAGEVSCWLQPWIPLMQGGNDVSIIERWQAAALRHPGQPDRDMLASLVCVFAELVGARSQWQEALKEFNVKRSQLMEEARQEGREEERRQRSQMMEEVRREGREEGRTEGREEGSLETLRQVLLRLGRERFGRVTSPARRAVQAITDRDRLDRMAVRIVKAESWDDVLETP